MGWGWRGGRAAQAGRLHLLDGRVLALEPGLHEDGVGEDEDGARADEPEEEAEGVGDDEEGDADDKEGNVQRLLGDDLVADGDGVGACASAGRADIHIGSGPTKLVDGGKATCEQADDDEEERVGEAAISGRRSAKAHRAQTARMTTMRR